MLHRSFVRQAAEVGQRLAHIHGDRRVYFPHVRLGGQHGREAVRNAQQRVSHNARLAERRDLDLVGVEVLACLDFRLDLQEPRHLPRWIRHGTQSRLAILDLAARGPFLPLQIVLRIGDPQLVEAQIDRLFEIGGVEADEAEVLHHIAGID